MSQGFTSQLPVPLPVAKGGTGRTESTAYAVLCGGTTSSSNYQSVSGVGSAGQVLTSNGSGLLPTFKDQTGGTGTISSWVLFDGTGTVSITSSGNVSSITDIGVGIYNVNITNALSSANYTVYGTAAGATTNASTAGILCANDGATTRTTALFSLAVIQAGGTAANYYDSNKISAMAIL